MGKIIEEQRARADAVRWFNAFDFGEFQARGREASGAKFFNGTFLRNYWKTHHHQTFPRPSSLKLSPRSTRTLTIAVGRTAPGR